jgi:aconitate hydratase
MASLAHFLLTQNHAAPMGTSLPAFGEPLTLKVQQTLTQDSTGTMVYLQLESLDPDALKTECSVAYIDHNMLQASYESADDHAYIASICRRYGIIYSKPGNGICHQLHLENFAKPGKVLIGSDSHTPTCGAMAMLAIGAGGLDVAIGMASGTYTTTMPRVIGIHLTGKRQPWISSKDVVFSLLEKLTVSGGVNAILEYMGPGVNDLTLTERATITNMGAELGATTSLFPSDEQTLAFLTQVHRSADYKPLSASDDAQYDDLIELDLGLLTHKTAAPHSPDCIVEVSDHIGLKIDQVAIGSCSNASYSDLMTVSEILKGKTVHPDVSLVISPGSSAILEAISQNGALTHLIAAGARILESGCGPCIGMGQAPQTDGVSLRTFNRNFKGRSGTASAEVYLVSPAIAAFSAIKGVLALPDRDQGTLTIPPLKALPTSQALWVKPEQLGAKKDFSIVRGPNIKPFPKVPPFTDDLSLTLNLIVGDDISTDTIMPSHAGLLPYRSNVPKLSESCFGSLDPQFATRAKGSTATLILAGNNYGQGSSREHAALVPLYLGVRVVIAKSFARIHRANLINNGIIPLVCTDSQALFALELGTTCSFSHLKEALTSGQVIMTVESENTKSFPLLFEGNEDELNCLLLGGALLKAAQK